MPCGVCFVSVPAAGVSSVRRNDARSGAMSKRRRRPCVGCSRARGAAVRMVAGESGGNGTASNGTASAEKEVMPPYVSVPRERVRNFSIIAHIDHGKSTLADRLLEKTNAVSERELKAQFLDSMDLERERGITIKLQTARMTYRAKDGELYALNLIDTPGHVDFSYEVSRSLLACEGALLVVDASQGVEAQTLANVYLALEQDLEIIPVLNKIDLPGADVDRVIREVEEVVGLDCSAAVRASAKNGIGIEEVLEAIVNLVPPPPAGHAEKPLRALIYDSYYDAYRGVVTYFRVVDGEMRTGDRLRLFSTKKAIDADEIGVLVPKQVPCERLVAGEVGYLIGGMKSVEDAKVGDTIVLDKKGAELEPIPGFQEAKPMVFAGLFPIDADEYASLKAALYKLKLNDAALSFEPEVSGAMGFGFRCGFLGLLHMDVVQERLEREHNIELITTAPSVVYRVKPVKGEAYEVDNPFDLPDPSNREYIEEPFVRLDMITPEEYVGPLMELAQERRGEFKDMRYLVVGRTTLVYELPLAELVTDFFDHLKSRSKGYASMEYSLSGYRENDLVKMDVSVNSEPIDALSCIVHRSKAYSLGRALTEKLKELIPRQQFKVPIQAMLGAKVIASEHIPALRKDVLAKCYGGDITRKKKLLKKQAAGKKRMKSVGRVDVPQEAFMAMLNVKRE